MHSRRVRLYAIAVALWTGLLATAALRTQSDWWYEDDPLLYSRAARAASPLDAFFDVATVQAYGTAAEFVPILQFSFWVDSRIAWGDPTVAYLHNIVSFILSALALFYLMNLLFKDPRWAFGTTIAWTLLPSTIATHEYLSTRCYMEGLLFSLLALILVVRIVKGSLRESPAVLVAVGFLSLVSLLAKEFFPPVTLTAIFLLGWKHKKWKVAATAVAVGAIYAGWRLAMIGGTMEYGGMPTLSGGDFLLFLGKLPYYFAGGWGGYLLAAFAVGLLALGWKSRPQATNQLLLLLAVLLFLGVATVYPVSYALNQAWNDHGPWVRSGFVFHTIALAFGVVLLHAVPSKKIVAAGWTCILVSLFLGATVTSVAWSANKAHYRAEGEFLLDGTGRALYSTVPAPWFLTGLQRLFAVARSRRYLRSDSPCDASLKQWVATVPTLWRYQDGKIVSDDGLLSVEKARCK